MFLSQQSHKAKMSDITTQKEEKTQGKIATIKSLNSSGHNRFLSKSSKTHPSKTMSNIQNPKGFRGG